MNKSKLDIWEKRINEQKASGMTVPDWCNQNQLSKHAYYYWHKRIRLQKDEECIQAPVFAKLNTVPKKNDKTLSLQVTWRELQLVVSNTEDARLAAEFIIQLQKLC